MEEGERRGAQVSGHVALRPEVVEAGDEKFLEEGEAEGGGEEEAEEVGKCGVRDAVCGPGAVVVHFGDASVGGVR